MGEVYEKDKKFDELARHLDAYLKKWGAQGGPDRQVLAHFRLGEMAWKASCPKASEDGACLEVKRVAATGRQKVFYDLNKKRKKGQKIKEPKRTQCGPPTSSKIIVFDRNKGPAGEGPGALPDRAEDLEQGRGRFEDHRQGRRGARRPGVVRGRRRRRSTWRRRSTRRSCASSSPTASTSSSRANTTTRRRPRRRRRRPRSR